MGAKCASAQPWYKYHFDRTVRRTPQIFPEQHLFGGRPLGQMPEPARIVVALPTKTLQKTIDPFRAISSTADTATGSVHGIQNTVIKDRNKLAPYNPQGYDGTNRDHNMQIENHRKDEDRTDENGGGVMESF